MQSIYELAPVIADVISAHCPGTTAREHLVRAYLGGHWYEAKCMIEGMLAEPWLSATAIRRMRNEYFRLRTFQSPIWFQFVQWKARSFDCP